MSETGLPTIIPAASTANEHDERDEVQDIAPAATKPAEQLGFQMRFEAGRALLALDDKAADGVIIRRALFEVPDVAFPLDVSGGALRFQNNKLTLRAVELAITWQGLFSTEELHKQGLTLVRERSRQGGLEVVVTLPGTAGPVPVRARLIFAPTGGGGTAIVVHELIAFSPLPRPRLDLAPALLDALRFPGGRPARAMIRRAEPFRAVFSRLLPQYGWKVPALGEVRVHEAVLGKGEVVLRAWSGQPPEGWKAPRPAKKGGPLQEAISLAVFADALSQDGPQQDSTDEARVRLVDRLLDDSSGGDVASSLVPFLVEVLASDARRRQDARALLERALKDDDEHLGLLSAFAAEEQLSSDDRARRLLRLSEVADDSDEPWVAGRAALQAARLYDDAGDLDKASDAAHKAAEADPSVAEAGMLHARLLSRRGDAAAALAAGRAALDRAGSGSLIEPADDVFAQDTFATELAAIALVVEGSDAARALLRRALRTADRSDALTALVELDINDGRLDDAAENLTRLLGVVEDGAPRRTALLLAARLAEQRGDISEARTHLLAARHLAPKDAAIATGLARIAADPQHALAALAAVVDEDDDDTLDDNERAARDTARIMAARTALQRGDDGDATRASTWLARLPEATQRSDEVVRLDALARAALGDSAPLGALLLRDADNASDDADKARLQQQAASHLAAAGQHQEATRAYQEAASLFSAAGDNSSALNAIITALNTPALADERSLQERRFALALVANDGDDGDGVEVASAALLVRGDLDVDTRRDIRRKVIAAARNDADVRTALERWLDEEPTLFEPLEAYCDRVRVDFEGRRLAVARLDTACRRADPRARPGDEVRALIMRVASTAVPDDGEESELRANELLLGFDLDEATREATQHRLVVLCKRHGLVDRAVDLQYALISSAEDKESKDVDAIAKMWLHASEMHEYLQKDAAAAATALQAYLRYAPNDAERSERLLSLLQGTGDATAIIAECLRRAALLSASTERTALWLRAARLLEAREDFLEARRIALRAVRSAPHTPDAVELALELAKRTESKRATVRTYLAKARALKTEQNNVAAAAAAAEAGGLLAGLLHRTRLATVVFSFAQNEARNVGAPYDSYTRMLVELYRALADGPRAYEALTTLLDADAIGKERARLLEARAEISASLLNNSDGAIDDRRAALAIDPSYGPAARALARLLVERGDHRAAIEVDRAFVDVSAEGEVRAFAYARLAQQAEEHTGDDALVAELCEISLRDSDDVDVRRRLLSARLRQDDPRNAIAAMRGLFDATGDVGERISVGLQLSAALRDAGEGDDAISVLRAVLDDEHTHGAPRYDEVVTSAADLLADAGRLSEAAATLLSGLRIAPEAPAFQEPHAVLERAGAWLDDADEESDGDTASRALEVLCAAAESGALSDDGEGRRARLAEELHHPAIAAAALDSLISRNIEVSANARRLATAAEAIDDPRRALRALLTALDATDTEGADDIAGIWANIDRLTALLVDRAESALVRDVAARKATAGHVETAVDLLLSLAERLDGDVLNAVLDDAAELATRESGAPGAGARILQPRLNALRPAIARDDARRDRALTELRDVEAWADVVTLLEDAIDVTNDRQDRRRLRFEVTAVLRDGIDDDSAHARAAAHLEKLVDEDDGDREAWGELFECKERLNDKDGLQQALGRRALVIGVSKDNLESRQLVRRRAELLLSLNRYDEGIAVLAEVRPAGDDEPEARALALALHRAKDGNVDGRPAGAGLNDDGPSTVAFYAAELDAAGAVADAETILSLAADTVHTTSPTLRVQALAITIVDDHSAAAAATRVTTTTWQDHATTQRHDEATALAHRLAAKPALLAAYLTALASQTPQTPSWGAAAALQLTDSLYDDTLVSEAASSVLREHYARQGFLRRKRIGGVAQTARDVARLDGRAKDVALLRVASRTGDVVARDAAASNLGVTLPNLSALAQQTLDAAPRKTPTEVFDAAVARDDVTVLSAIATAARRARDSRLHIAALDALFERRAPTARERTARADAAFDTQAKDSASLASLAAAVTVGDVQLRLRRRAIELSLRDGDTELLSKELLALAATGGADSEALRSEARSTAEAAGLIDVVDTLLGQTDGDDVDLRTTAIIERAQLRARKREPQSAFDILVKGAASIGDASYAQRLRDEAYAVATQHGLTEAAFDVVDDALAEAGLAACFGRTDFAKAKARAHGSVAAGWLLLELSSSVDGRPAGAGLNDTDGIRDAWGLIGAGARANDDPLVKAHKKAVREQQLLADVRDADDLSAIVAERLGEEGGIAALAQALADDAPAIVRLGAALSAHAEHDAGRVISSIAEVSNRPWPLTRALATAELHAGTPGAAARTLLAVTASDLDADVLTLCKQVAQQAAREGAMGDAARLAAHMARISDDGTFVAMALGLADAAGGDTALALGKERLQQRDVRALALLAHHSLEGSAAQGYFGAWHALRSGVRTFTDHAPADFQRIRALKDAADKDTPDAPTTAPATPLLRARLGRKPQRQAAWREYAESVDVTSSPFAELSAARLLMRAGTPMSEAPLSVRLAVDPALQDDGARAAAIASALGDTPAAARAGLITTFDTLTQRGATTAAQRLAIDTHRDVARAQALVACDVYDTGGSVDITALVKGLGRHPDKGARALVAGLVQQKHAALAQAVLPHATPPPENDAPQTLHDIDAGDENVSLSRLLLSQLRGPRAATEEQIASLANKLGRTDVEAHSLLRLARLRTTPAEQAAALLAHAHLSLTRGKVKAAIKSAETAGRLSPSPEAASLLTTIAEQHGDPAAIEKALLAQTATAPENERSALVLKRAALLANELSRPVDAIAAIDDRLSEVPQGDVIALASEKARLHEVMGQPREAALSLLTALDLDGVRASPTERIQLRRRSSALLHKQGDDDALALAVSALCEAHGDGDPSALDDAESIARSKEAPALTEALKKVLDLRLRDTDDISARRVIVLEQAKLLHESGDAMGAISLLEAQAVADPIDLGARLALASWYLESRRILDAALAFESAARIPGLPPMGYGPPAREAAALLGALGDLERAGPLADMATTAGVTDLEVLSVAEAWHRLHERWGTVDELLGKELEHIADSRKEAHLWMERASVRREHLEDHRGAKEATSRVLELIPDHPRALSFLRQEAERSDTWGALRMALFRAVEVSSDARQQAEWLREIAVIDSEHLGDAKASEASLERSLSLDPDNITSLVLKATNLVKAGTIDGVSAVLERVERLSTQQGTAATLPGMLQLVRGDALVLAGDTDSARAAFLAATEDPDTAAKAWDRLIDMDDGTQTAFGTIDEARKSTLDSQRRLSLWRRELRLRKKLGDDTTEAAANVLALAPGDDDALDIVRDAYTRRRKQKELLPFIVAHARAATNDEQSAQRLAVAGSFALDELGQEVQARAYYEEALQRDANEKTALVRLADIAWASRDDERALELLDRITPEQWLLIPTDDGLLRDASELLLRRARCAYATGKSDVRDRLRLVLRQDAKHRQALELLAKVALDGNDDESAELALESLSQAISPQEDPVRLAGVLVDLAQLRLRRGKANDAAAAAERAVELNPTSLQSLHVVAEAREGAGRFVEAAEAWRRLAALRSGAERVAALEHRIALLERAERLQDAAHAWLDLHKETGDAQHKTKAQEKAQAAGLPDPFARSPDATTRPRPLSLDLPAIEVTQTDVMPVAPGGKGGALVIQIRANLDAGDYDSALKLALAAKEQQPLDAATATIAIDTAMRANRKDALVELTESRLQAATEPAEIKALAVAAGRVARDELHDDDRAAALLYQAHQADAEDIEVRLELTELYARIPRLASHAVTGVLQLLRRTPADPRVFALAGDLAHGQGQEERATAMRAIESVLCGTGVPQELMQGRWSDERMTSRIAPLDKENISARLAPTGWGSPFHQLITLLGVHLEVAFRSEPAPTGSKPLVQASPRSASMMERIDRLLPGRQVQVLMADVDRPTVCAGGVPQVIVPRDVIVHDGALQATIARGVALCRMGCMMSELVKPGTEDELIALLKAGLLGEGTKDARSELLTARLTPEEKAQATALFASLLSAPIDINGTLQLMARACDRFVLVATGSAIAALQAHALPSLVKEPPQRAMLLLQGSVRALELCAFAARDNAWMLRKQLLL